MFRTIIQISVLAGLALSCATSTSLRTAKGLQHNDLAYSVSTQADGRYISPSWIDDTKKVARNVKIPLRAGAKNDSIKFKSPDLLLQNNSNSSEIVLRSYPLGETSEKRDVSVLLQDLVDNVGQDPSLSIFERSITGSNSKAENYAAKIIEQQALDLPGIAEGIVATIEIAKSSQLQLNPESRFAKLRYFILKPKKKWSFEHTLKYVENGKTRYRDEVEFEQPGVVAIAYISRPSDFDKNLADAESFVKSIRFTPAQ